MNVGINNSVLKVSNQGLLLWLVLSGRSSSRINVAKEAGLSKMTATNILGEFLDNEILHETSEPLDGKRGRPVRMLSLSPKAPKLIGVYVGPSYARVSLFDLEGRNIKGSHIPFTSEDTQLNFGKIQESIDQIIRSSINERILGISISGVGEIDGSNGIVQVQESFPLSGVKVSKVLQDRYGLPVFLSNASDAAGFMEFYKGAAKGINDFLYLDIDENITGSIFADGKPLKGKKGNAPELGHISIDYNGLSCTCGKRGCLQSYISSAAMEKKLRDITKLKVDFQGFCEMQSKKNDSRIDWALKDMMDKTGFGVSNILSLSPVDTVVIGGKGVYIPDRYLSKLEKSISTKESPVKVVKAANGATTLDSGAPSALLTAVFNGELVLY